MGADVRKTVPPALRLVAADCRGLAHDAAAVNRAANVTAGIAKLLNDNLTRRASEGPEPFLDDYTQGALADALALAADRLAEVGERWEDKTTGARVRALEEA